MNNTNLSEQIRKLRESKKMTLAVMAERLGVTTSAISAYENGTRNPSFDVLVKIARIFNVTVDNLLYTDKDLIDVSGLTVQQRENIQDMIITYKKLNMLVSETFELKGSDIDMSYYLSNDYDTFKECLKKKKSENQ